MENTKRARVTRAEWAKRVQRWKDSGLTAEEFASELGMNAQTLKYWKYTLNRQARGGSVRPVGRAKTRRRSNGPKFIELASAAAPGLMPSLVVEAPGGYRVLVPEQFKTEHLSQLLRALEHRV